MANLPQIGEQKTSSGNTYIVRRVEQVQAYGRTGHRVFFDLNGRRVYGPMSLTEWNRIKSEPVTGHVTRSDGRRVRITIPERTQDGHYVVEFPIHGQQSARAVVHASSRSEMVELVNSISVEHFGLRQDADKIRVLLFTDRGSFLLNLA